MAIDARTKPDRDREPEPDPKRKPPVSPDDVGPDDDEAAEPTEAEIVDMAVEHEVQKRLWTRLLMQMINQRHGEPDVSPRVQLAHDKVQIAASERLCRIINSDIAYAGEWD